MAQAPQSTPVLRQVRRSDRNAEPGRGRNDCQQTVRVHGSPPTVRAFNTNGAHLNSDRHCIIFSSFETVSLTSNRRSRRNHWIVSLSGCPCALPASCCCTAANACPAFSPEGYEGQDQSLELVNR